MRARRLIAAATCVAIGACGGGDDASTDGGGDGNEVDDASAGTDDTASADVSGGTDDASTDGSGDAAGAPGCDEVFSLDEIEEWFGEPADATEAFTPSTGQLVCTWETIEDPDDLDDLAFQLITAQVFTGEPVPAANFIDPEIFDDITMLDGAWDLAFSDESFGLTFYFLDEPIAGSFDYSDVDIGDPDAPKRHTRDEVEVLFRRFHQRVAG